MKAFHFHTFRSSDVEGLTFVEYKATFRAKSGERQEKMISVTTGTERPESMMAMPACDSVVVVATADMAPPASLSVRQMALQERKPSVCHSGLKRDRESEKMRTTRSKQS